MCGRLSTNASEISLKGTRLVLFKGESNNRQRNNEYYIYIYLAIVILRYIFPRIKKIATKNLQVEAGADFIITQICFESEIFIDFVKDCRKIGIQVPILPGIFAPTSYKYLEKMADICRVDVPMEIKNDLARIKDDDQATRKFIIDLTVRIITDIIKSGTTRGFHLFTLNR